MIPVRDGVYLKEAYEQPINPANYGLIADSNSHPLSQRYGTLAAAQAAYPHVPITALTQEIDWAACTMASIIAFGPYGRENGNDVRRNKPLYIPPGEIYLGNDPWVIRDLNGGFIQGAGKRATTIRGTNIVMKFDGLWYTYLGDLSLEGIGNTPETVLDVDGNTFGSGAPDASPYLTRGVQGNFFSNFLCHGAGRDYVVAFGRVGTNGAQGDQNIIINMHLTDSTEACFLQRGTNFLSNLILSGNIQLYEKHGISVEGGTLSVHSTAFQPLSGYRQIVNDGYDIDVGGGGDLSGVSIIGCRSEGLRFIRNGGAVSVNINTCVLRNGVLGPWQAGNSVTADGKWGAILVYFAAENGYRMFVKQNAGSHITGATEPTWPTDGSTVNDGGVVWQEETNYAFNLLGNNTIDRSTCFDYLGAGKIKAPYKKTMRSSSVNTVDDDFTDYWILDCTGGNRTITLVDPPAAAETRGREVTVKKTDTTANTLTVSSAAGFEDGAATKVIAGGSRGVLRLVWGQTAGEAYRWLIV